MDFLAHMYVYIFNQVQGIQIMYSSSGRINTSNTEISHQMISLLLSFNDT